MWSQRLLWGMSAVSVSLTMRLAIVSWLDTFMLVGINKNPVSNYCTVPTVSYHVFWCGVGWPNRLSGWRCYFVSSNLHNLNSSSFIELNHNLFDVGCYSSWLAPFLLKKFSSVSSPWFLRLFLVEPNLFPHSPGFCRLSMCGHCVAATAFIITTSRSLFALHLWFRIQ